MTGMKRGVKTIIASIATLILVAAGIITAPLLKNLLNDIANPAYKETKIFPDDYKIRSITTQSHG